MKLAWIDIRFVPTGQREAVVDAAIHARVDAIIDNDPEFLATLPATVKRVLASDLQANGENIHDGLLVSCESN